VAVSGREAFPLLEKAFSVFRKFSALESYGQNNNAQDY